MKTKKVDIELPPDLYADLQLVAEASGWALKEVIVQTLRTGSLPNLSKIPDDFHDDLVALYKLSDRDLLRVVEGDLPSPTKMDERRRKADFEVLRRTYALFILRWRGHPVPRVYEALIN
jgi:hypothetical protein